MKMSGIFDVILRRNRTLLKTGFLNQYIVYFQKRYGAKLEFNEETGTCTVTRSDGNSMRFEPLTFVEIFDTATAFCEDPRHSYLSAQTKRAGDPTKRRERAS